MEVPVVIVGAGPAGIATSGCLNKLSIPNIVLERDDCHASLWRKRTYDRLKLHLGKDFCSLPHLPFSSDLPTFIPRVDFMRYLDDYVTHFNISIRYNRSVVSASMDYTFGKWRLLVKDTSSNVDEVYVADYLVVATGENSEGSLMISQIGGANTSIVIRSPVHYFTKEMVFAGMHLLKYLKVDKMDKVMVFMSKMVYGDVSKFGLTRPKDGPFTMKIKGGRTPTIDVGCVEKIKKGKIKVYPAISSIKKDKMIEFEDGQNGEFDVIVFATGYKTNVLKWLKDYKDMFNENGLPKPTFPNHWKGENGIYCAGFSKRGLEGIAFDAKQIADDIKMTVNARKDAGANTGLLEN
ncbi:hypothetical protein SESBI_42571 [Sesbania bispinosa]|nr:hypothetical protein SESBI_42571 [Sesbania bispinosa]